MHFATQSNFLTRLLSTLAVIGALTPTAFSQSDDCVAPTVGVLGANPFDNSSATHSAMDGGGGNCSMPGTIGLPPAPGHDLFWVFSIPADGTYQFDTIGGGHTDTVLQVHTGTDCSASCLTNGDDYNGTSDSLVRIQSLTVGESFLLQVGSWGSLAGEPGVLNITDITLTQTTNDDCGAPSVAVLGANAWDNSLATRSGFEGGGAPCLEQSPFAAPKDASPEFDVFFSFVAPADDHYQFDTIGTGFNTVLNLHSGVGCVATCVGTDDNSGSGLPTGESSILALNALLGDAYLIQVGSWTEQAVGAGILNVSTFTAEPNDDCSTPTAIGLGATAFDNTLATTSGFDGGGSANCPITDSSDQPSRDLFYLFTPGTAGDFAVDSYGSGFDTVLSVHVGLDCGAMCLLSSDWGDTNGESRVEILGAQVGDNYLIQLGGFNGASSATGVLNVAEMAPTPLGDDCSAPAVLVGTGAFAFDNTAARSSFFDAEDALCLGNDYGAAQVPAQDTDEIPTRDLFWTWTPPADDDYVIDTEGSGINTILNVYTGTDCSATCLDSDDDGKPGQESVLFVQGATILDGYLIQVGSWTHQTTASGVLNIEVLAPAPTNDTCATPEVLIGEQAIIRNNAHPALTTTGFDGGDPANCMSSLNPGDPDPDSQIHSDLFFAWTAQCDGDYTIDTIGSPDVGDTKLNVHLGADCSALCVVSNDDIDDIGGDFLSQVALSGVLENDTFLIQVGNWGDSVVRGDLALNISKMGAPCNQVGLSISCDPAVDHFQGNYVKLDTSTFGSGFGSDLHLSATDGPTLQFGFVLVSPNTGNLPVFGGVLCVGSPQGRYSGQIAANQGLPQLNSIGQFDLNGDFVNLSSTGASAGGLGFDVPTELPFSPVGQTIGSGNVFYFQIWYRDQIAVPGDSANFSNMLEAMFP
jgi:hypothetical protein